MARLLVVFIVAGLVMGLTWLIGLEGSHWRAIPVTFICAALAFAINWTAALPAIAFRTETYFDLTGSLTYLSIVGVALWLAAPHGLRAQIVAAMVVIWAVRLGFMLFTRIRRAGEDKRFREIKANPARFLGVWTLQGMWVTLTSACAIAVIALDDGQPLGVIFYVGAAMWAVGFLLEVVADSQKNAFRGKPENRERFITHGLWAWSQHPNYFGEILLWAGIAVIALPVLGGWSWAALTSPVFVLMLLVRVSGIPTLDRAAKVKWGDDPAYKDYTSRTSKLIPLPPRRAS